MIFEKLFSHRPGVHGMAGRDPRVVARASLDPRLISAVPPGHVMLQPALAAASLAP